MIRIRTIMVLGDTIPQYMKPTKTDKNGKPVLVMALSAGYCRSDSDEGDPQIP